MDEQGVGVQALSLTAPMVYWAPTDLARRLCEAYNDACVAAHEAHPDRFETLQTSFRKVFDDPDYKASVLGANGYWEYINHGGVAECAKFKEAMLALGERYKDHLTGS